MKRQVAEFARIRNSRRGPNSGEFGSRRAKTIIELLVIVSMLSVVFAGSVTTLAAMFRLDRQFRRDLEQSQSLARLSSRLRSDAHEAQSVQVGAGLVLALPDGREIHYTAAERAITREVRRGAAMEHRDAYYLPAGAKVTLTADERLLRLTVRPNAPPATGVPPVTATTIEAAIGLPRQEAPR